MEDYYVLRRNGIDGRLAKIVDGAFAYGWENGEWVEMQGLIKIRFDGSEDFVEISKEEAEKIIESRS